MCPVGSILWHSGAVSGGLFRQTLHSLFYLLSQLLYLSFSTFVFGVASRWYSSLGPLSELWSGRTEQGKLGDSKVKSFLTRSEGQSQDQSLEIHHKEHINTTPCHIPTFSPVPSLSVQAKDMSRHYSWRNDRNERNSGAFPSRHSQLWVRRPLPDLQRELNQETNGRSVMALLTLYWPLLCLLSPVEIHNEK